MTNKKTIEQFLNELGSKAPAPGGGGSAGVSGAMGAALCEMVCSLTIGKKKYENVKEEMETCLKKAQASRKTFMDLCDADEEVFLPLSKAYALKKDTEEEKEIRNRVMEEALSKAVTVPFRILEECCQFLDTLKFVALNGSILASSDAYCSAAILKSSLESAYVNVLVNTRLMKNRETAEVLNQKSEILLQSGTEKAEEIMRIVNKRLMK